MTRKHLPDTRPSITRKITIVHTHDEKLFETEIYATVGLYEDGKPAEIFLKAGKMGETLSGLMDALSIALSIGLQHGIPLEEYTSKFTNMRFHPAGKTGDPEMRSVSSVIDAVARWLDKKFPTTEKTNGASRSEAIT